MFALEILTVHGYQMSESLGYTAIECRRETDNEFCSIDLMADASNEASFLRTIVAFLASSENECGKLACFLALFMLSVYVARWE